MGGTRAQDMDIEFKVKYEDEQRFLIVKAEEMEALNGLWLYDLKASIFELFKLNGDAQKLEIRFTDEDGDVLIMSNDKDFAYVLNHADFPFRLEVSWSKELLTSLKNCRGPCGGGGGTYWNDGTFEGIIGITVTTDYISLRSIQLTYATGNGEAFRAPRHGGGGKKICTVFKYPTEKLRKISGYCGVVCGKWTVIKCLSFETNLARYGPFGVASWVPFQLDLTSTNVVGFYG